MGGKRGRGINQAPMSIQPSRNPLLASGNIRRSSFVWNLLSAAMNSFQTMLLLVFITRFGTDADSASFVMAYAAGNLLFNIGKYGVRQFQVTDSVGQYSFRDYRRARLVSLAVMAVSVVAFIGTGLLFRGYTGRKAAVVALICLYKGVEAAEDVYHGRMQQQGRLDVAGRILFLRIFSFVLCFAALFVLTRDILLTAAVATALAAFLAVVLNRSVWAGFRDPSEAPSRTGQLLKACAPICLTMLLNMFVSNAPKYIIDGRVTDALQSQFNIVFMPVFVLALLGTFIYQPELKSIGEARKDRQIAAIRKKVLRLTLLTLAVTLPVVAVGWFAGIPVLEFIYKTPLAFLRPQLILFIFCGCFIALINLYGMVLIAFRRQGTLTAVCVLSALALFCFGAGVLASGGIPGLSWFFMAVLAVHALLLAFFAYRAMADEERAAAAPARPLPLAEQVAGKKVLFVSTKNLDYLRNVQEIALLRKHAAQVTVIASPASSYFSRLLTVCTSLLRTSVKGYDLVFTGFAPQLLLPWFRRLRKKPVIEDFFISLYDTFTQDRRLFKPDSLPGKLLLKLDRKTLALGNTVIADTRAHAEYFASGLGCDPEKIQVLYLEADTEIYHPMPVEKEPGAPFHVLYFGSILPLQGVDVVLGAIRLIGADPDYSFEVIGPLEEKDIPDQSNLACHPWLSQQELAAHIARADLCLAGHFSPTIDKAKRTIPGKAYIFRAMEKPMVLGDTPANHELYTADSRTFFSPPGDPAALAETIRRARDQLAG